MATMAAAATPSITLYVAPGGKDAWSGRLEASNAAGSDGPFATLARAVKAAREARRGGRKDVQVLVRGGTYRLAETLVFSPEDSGAKDHPVLYAAYPNERPVLSGGRPITQWRKGEGELGKLWVADVTPGWYFTRLFVNGERRTRSRTPNTDNWNQWLKVVAGGPPEADAPEGMGSRQFQFPGGTVRNWSNPGDVEINSLPSYRYANFICPVESVNEATSMVTMTSMAYYNYQPGDPFRIENTLDGLDRPGEWCVNSVSGKVYYWPRPGENMATAEVIAPALKQLVRFKGDEEKERWVHDIALRGFTFVHCDRTRWNERPPDEEANLHQLDASVYLEGTERCAIEDCRFIDVAGFAARFNLTARDNRFVGNEVVGAGCGGVQAGGYGPGTKDTNQGHEISHNHLHHCSTDFWHAAAIDVRQSGENHVAFNLIHDLPYTAVMIAGAHTSYFRQYRGKRGVGRADYRFRWDEIPADNPLTAESVKPFLHARNNLVENNVVYEVLGRMPADGGGLYGFGQGLGNVFRNNLVYRAHCLAIYLDAEYDGVLVENNVVYDSAAPFGGSGAYPTLTNNFLYERGQEPPEVRVLGEQMTRLAEQTTGPYWHRTVAATATVAAIPPRDPAKRRFEADLKGLEQDELAGQGSWLAFGSAGGMGIIAAERSGACDPGLVALAGGEDSWVALRHGMILDPTRAIVVQLDARLPDPPQANNFFELYLNRGLVHASAAFGLALVGGKETATPDEVGMRQDAAGPRVLAAERLTPGHWYRLRLVIPAGTQQARMAVRDLTAGETEFRPLTFAGGATEADITAAEAWSPPLADLDALVLRLGSGTQAPNL
ncbi:MAG: right-handed parallel beta-helix repeat-containing protein, partial [Armatimonadota bacterium]